MQRWSEWSKFCLLAVTFLCWNDRKCEVIFLKFKEGKFLYFKNVFVLFLWGTSHTYKNKIWYIFRAIIKMSVCLTRKRRIRQQQFELAHKRMLLQNSSTSYKVGNRKNIVHLHSIKFDTASFIIVSVNNSLPTFLLGKCRNGS